MNRIFIDGRLGRAPEEVGSGDNKVVKFSIAQNHEYTNKRNEKVSKTHWFNVVCFGRLGAACAANLVSGQDVTVEGSLQENSWTDDAGNRRSRHEIRAQNVKFGLRPKGSEAPSSAASADETPAPAAPAEEASETPAGDSEDFDF